jgi:hypothetical protein
VLPSFSCIVLHGCEGSARARNLRVLCGSIDGWGEESRNAHPNSKSENVSLSPRLHSGATSMISNFDFGWCVVLLKRVVRYFIEATLECSEAPGAYVQASARSHLPPHYFRGGARAGQKGGLRCNANCRSGLLGIGKAKAIATTQPTVPATICL